MLIISVQCDIGYSVCLTNGTCVAYLVWFAKFAITVSNGSFQSDMVYNVCTNCVNLDLSVV